MDVDVIGHELWMIFSCVQIDEPRLKPLQAHHKQHVLDGRIGLI